MRPCDTRNAIAGIATIIALVACWLVYEAVRWVVVRLF